MRYIVKVPQHCELITWCVVLDVSPYEIIWTQYKLRHIGSISSIRLFFLRQIEGPLSS